MSWTPPLSTRNAAKYLGVSESTLRRWRDERKGPEWVKYEDSIYRYTVAALDAFMRESRGK